MRVLCSITLSFLRYKAEFLAPNRVFFVLPFRARFGQDFCKKLRAKTFLKTLCFFTKKFSCSTRQVSLLHWPWNPAPLRARFCPPHRRPGRPLNPLAQGKQAPECPGAGHAGPLTHDASQAASSRGVLPSRSLGQGQAGHALIQFQGRVYWVGGDEITLLILWEAPPCNVFFYYFDGRARLVMIILN